MSIAPVQWLFWPEAMTWLVSHDRAATAEIGRWFRERMAENRSAAYVHEIRLSEVALEHLQLPESQDLRSQAAAAALEAIERDLLQMLEHGTCTARGKRSETASPELIPAWDWADSIITASRSFELRGTLNREVKFVDVRIDASGLTGWNESPPPSQAESVSEISTAAPWTEDQMMSAIAACAIANRDRAWNEVFGPQRSEHQWDVRAFREIWSRGRGTQGMKGRQGKRANKDAL